MTVAITTRPATPADHERLFALHEAAHRTLVEQAYGPWDDAQQRQFFAPLLDEHDVHVVEHEGVAVGAVYLGERDGDTWVELVEVEPAHQGRGVGGAVLALVHEQARAEGRGVLLKVHRVNEAARRLYLREGFVPVGEDETHHHLRRA